MIRDNFLRLRLETDRLVRSRAFIGRALGGYLERSAYAELLGALSLLVPADLHALARSDLGELDLDQPQAQPLTLSLYQRALGRSRARQRLASAAGLAVIGTSWTGEAGERLQVRYPNATSFLDQLSWRGSGEIEALSRRGDEAIALGELARGAFFGAIAELEIAWPPPRLATPSWSASVAGQLPAPI
jgi:hypothetical protein